MRTGFTRSGFAVAVVIGCAATAIAGTSAALADPGCNSFFNNPDGSWTPTHPIMIGSPTSQTQLMPSDRLRAGAPGVRGRLGAFLDTHCRLGGNVVRAVGIPKMP
jgi:hypothetical protein